MDMPITKEAVKVAIIVAAKADIAIEEFDDLMI